MLIFCTFVYGYSKDSKIFSVKKNENFSKIVDDAINCGIQFIYQNFAVSKYRSTVVAVHPQKEGQIYTNVMRIIDVPPNKARKSISGLSDEAIMENSFE